MQDVYASDLNEKRLYAKITAEMEMSPENLRIKISFHICISRLITFP
jgi:hypothetical protein